MTVKRHNVPVLNLRLDRMKDAVLQLQMVIPSLETNASFTATLKRYEDLVMDVETAFNFPKTSCIHKTSLKYGKSSKVINRVFLAEITHYQAKWLHVFWYCFSSPR